MTRLMNRHLALVRCPYVIYTEDVDYELSELVRSRCKRLGALLPIRLIVEQFFVENPDHAGARPGRSNNVIAIIEYSDKAPGKIARLAVEAAVERRLTAASLRGREVHFHTESSKHTYHAHPNFGKDLIHQTGDEQRYFHNLIIKRRCVDQTAAERTARTSAHR